MPEEVTAGIQYSGIFCSSNKVASLAEKRARCAACNFLGPGSGDSRWPQSDDVQTCQLPRLQEAEDQHLRRYSSMPVCTNFCYRTYGLVPASVRATVAGERLPVR